MEHEAVSVKNANARHVPDVTESDEKQIRVPTSENTLLKLQRTIGNRTVGRLIQANLEVTNAENRAAQQLLQHATRRDSSATGLSRFKGDPATAVALVDGFGAGTYSEQLGPVTDVQRVQVQRDTPTEPSQEGKADDSDSAWAIESREKVQAVQEAAQTAAETLNGGTPRRPSGRSSKRRPATSSLRGHTATRWAASPAGSRKP